MLDWQAQMFRHLSPMLLPDSPSLMWMTQVWTGVSSVRCVEKHPLPFYDAHISHQSATAILVLLSLCSFGPNGLVATLLSNRPILIIYLS